MNTGEGSDRSAVAKDHTGDSYGNDPQYRASEENGLLKKEKESFVMNIDMIKDNFTAVHTLPAFLGDGIVRIRKIDKELPDENTYLKANDIIFHNGIIEVDVCGKLLEDAPDYARGFIGIVFRASNNDSEFESFYIRPTNGKGCTDPGRKAHGCQYFSYPGYTFPLLSSPRIKKNRAFSKIITSTNLLKQSQFGMNSPRISCRIVFRGYDKPSIRLVRI